MGVRWHPSDTAGPDSLLCEASVVEFLIEILGEFLFEFVLQLGAEFFVEFGARATGRGASRARPAYPVLVAIGLFALGAALGALATLVVPARLLPPPVVPGLSLVLSPVLAGGAMHIYGRWRRSRGRVASPLATFWGGALFAVGFALVRFLLVTSGFANRAT